MTQHAFLSPSDAPHWTRCLAKPHMERDLPNKSGKDAKEGTAAHELRALCLTSGKDALAYLGMVIEVEGDQFEVTEEMAGYVQTTIDVPRQMTGHMLVEERLNISTITGEKDAAGTADTVILDVDNARLIIDDLKYGKGVPVDAVENEQLMIYAGAALEEYALLGDFNEVTLRISQPRIDNDSEWTISVDELRARLTTISKYANAIIQGDKATLQATPGDKQCRFCKAKADCTALCDHVMSTVADDFVDLDKPVVPQLSAADERVRNSDNAHLAQCLSAVDLIEGWCTAVRAKAEAEMLAGREVPGYKLVQGKRGNRKWADPKEAEATMKAMRLKVEEMYDLSLISPTTAEKLAKANTIGPRQWPKLQGLITRSDGKPSVAPVTDKRPALTIASVEDQFSVVED